MLNIVKIVKNTYFEEYLLTAVSGYLIEDWNMI